MNTTSEGLGGATSRCKLLYFAGAVLQALPSVAFGAVLVSQSPVSSGGV